MSNKIAASEALNQLKAAFPGEYVCLKIELQGYTNILGIRTEFTCYSESQGHSQAGTLEAALQMALAKTPTATTTEDVDAIVSEIPPNPEPAPEATVPHFPAEDF